MWRAALLALLLLSGPATAADMCLTKREARAMFPRAYLYWHYLGNQRCWYNRRMPSRRLPMRARAEAPLPPIEPPAELLPVDPAAIAPLMPPLTPPTPPPFEPWEIPRKLDAPVFSTFQPGREPDVWPVPASSSGITAMLFGGLLAVACWLGFRRAIR